MTKNFSLFTTFTILAIFMTFFQTSCVTHKYFFSKNLFSDFQRLKINKVIAFEKKNKSKDITPTYFIDIGESIYPNKNNYKLEIAKTFKRPDKPNFLLETDYYYIAEDSSVKLILYQWDNLPTKKTKTFEDDKSKSVRFANFQTKFNQLSDSLTKQLGEPIHKNVEQNHTTDETFRDDVKWQEKNGLNAYLFMFGNNGN